MALPAPPPMQEDAQPTPERGAVTRVLERLRAGEVSGDALVERLNNLSLQAALHGRTFSPRMLLATFARRPEVTRRERKPPPSLP